MYQLALELFPYLVFLYLIDSLVYVRPGQSIVVSSPGRASRVYGPGLHLVGLSPLSEVIVTGESPGFLTSQGLYVLSPRRRRDLGIPEPADLDLMGFDELKDVTVEGRTLRLAGKSTLAAPSLERAHCFRRLILELHDAPAERRREHLLKAMTAEVDVDALRALRAEQLRLMPYIWSLSVVLWLGAFVALPVGLYTEWAARPDVLALMVVLGPLYPILLYLTYRTLRCCGMARRAALSGLSPMLMFPPAVVHAASFLGREIYTRFDPLAVASQLIPREAFLRLARKALAFLAQGRERAGKLPLAEYWEMREAVCRALLARVGTSPEGILAAVSATDSEAALYCPLCSAEYRRGFATCADCGVALMAFPPA
jgi:hypothetical protein